MSAAVGAALSSALLIATTSIHRIGCCTTAWASAAVIVATWYVLAIVLREEC